MAVLAAPAPARADVEDLAELDIEQLMDLEVTSVSKKAERLDEAPAAVFVLTQEQIRRSGVRTIPEALRLVPGIQVGRVDGNTWAISARGFNSVFAEKLLVMIDGRSVYTPLFAGTYWDIQDVLLEDLDRIEVVRGPGGTLWGANAVNGVIHIVTKKAAETQGLHLLAGGGDVEKRFFDARYGGKAGDQVHYRVYGKFYERGEFDEDGGIQPHDETYQGRGGFRTEWTPDERTSVTVQGDVYAGKSDGTTLFTDEITLTTTPEQVDGQVAGGNVLVRGEHRLSDAQDLSLQIYWDRADRDIEIFDYERQTVDVEFQHQVRLFELLDVDLPVWDTTDVIWGANFRYNFDDVVSDSFGVALDPDDRDWGHISGFVQGELRFWEERVRVTVGSKFEHNTFTGFEYQPSGRLAVIPMEQLTLWASVARAVRIPSRIQEDSDLGISPQVLPVFGPVPSSLAGNRDSDSEELLAFEAGFRVRPVERLFIDVAAYYNDYDELTSLDPGNLLCSDGTTVGRLLDGLALAPGATACLLGGNTLAATLEWGNGISAETYGAEVAISAIFTEWLSMTAAYTYFGEDFDLNTNSQPGLNAERTSPNHRVSLTAHVEMPYDTSMDATFHWVDDVEGSSDPDATFVTDVSDVYRLDLRFAWKPVEQLELSVVGQNLLHDSREDYGGAFGFASTQVPRGFYGAVRWNY